MLNLLAILVEFLGTFILLTVIVATGNPWAIGSTLAMLVYLGGPVSGGHFNPAVTAMMLFNRNIAFDNASAYLVVQVIAGILAGIVFTQLKHKGIL